MKRKLLCAAAAAAIAAVGTAYAARDAENENVAVLAQAGISLSQAIASAEQHAKGKAVRAEIENENGAAVYGVEVLDGTKATDVKVDARDGKVLSAQAERRDEGGDDGREGEGEDEDQR